MSDPMAVIAGVITSTFLTVVVAGGTWLDRFTLKKATETATETHEPLSQFAAAAGLQRPNRQARRQPLLHSLETALE